MFGQFFLFCYSSFLNFRLLKYYTVLFCFVFALFVSFCFVCLFGWFCLLSLFFYVCFVLFCFLCFVCFVCFDYLWIQCQLKMDYCYRIQRSDYLWSCLANPVVEKNLMSHNIGSKMEPKFKECFSSKWRYVVIIEEILLYIILVSLSFFCFRLLTGQMFESLLGAIDRTSSSSFVLLN